MSKKPRMNAVVRKALRARQRGLTLIELLVVLTILATLGTVMITQTTGLTNEARYDQTVRRLEQLQDAVIGREPYVGEDPTSVPPGFVADVGRLPLAGTALDMSELWDRSATGTPPTAFALQPLNGLDNETQMSVGWRGPYVRRPIGSDDLSDGWGRSFALKHSDGTDVDDATDSIGTISSPGSGMGDSFAQPLDVVLMHIETGPPAIDIDRTTGQVTLLLDFEYTSSGQEYAVVRLYGPVNGKAEVVAQDVVQNTLGPGISQSLPVTFSPADIPIGPKLLRAYQWSSSTAAMTADLTSQKKSLARRVTVPVGGVTLLNLELVGN